MANKTLWHSEAVQLGQIEVTVKQESKKSKYEGKPDYVDLIIGGNPRTYQVENPSCGEFFRGRTGQTILIEFRDSREQASIHLMGPPRGQSQPSNVAPKASPTTNQPPANTQQAAAPVNQPPPNNPAPPVPTQQHGKGMRAVEIRYDRTVNTGNYCNEKIGITIQLDPGVKAADALDAAKKFVNEHLAKEAPVHVKGGAI